MRILWLSWKDIQHPQAGGAEAVTSELIKRLIKDGHEVTLVTASYPGAKPKTILNGYTVVRVGGRVSVYWRAYRYVRQHLSNWPDFVVEEINTLPFCSRLYVRHVPRRLFFHMLCREIWFYQLPLPASLVGYILEPLYLKFLSRDKAITVSNSTKQDLVRYGFNSQNIAVISEGIQLEPVDKLVPATKYGKPTIVSLGSIRPMKRTIDQIRAFERAKLALPALQMKIAGDASGRYGKKVLAAVASSPYKHDIEYLGRISATEKSRLLQKAHLITVTSIKEGWGLIVTEAASQGTPAVVYDVDGLRDSVQHDKTGVICRYNTPADLAKNIVELLSDKARYQTLQNNAWLWSKAINFETGYQQFKEEIKI
ncbi:glycosyltransferase family 4 protein [Candidatus Saccharibacteria bacterium]|nr:glycosyltransferase family 4 protein [Candidatus Saccharibacteria bacterium]